MNGRLGGIARHDRSRGPIETLDHVSVTRELGVRGDLRGAIRPGKSGRRQVSLIEAESWAAALSELQPAPDHAMPWYIRRANLLVEGVRLPREPGRVIAIGKTLRIEITCECDPCSRMDEIQPGLKLALMPDWRGGVLGRVLTDGEIFVGDEVRIEE
ncbi:MAG: MOSC domain-containing protein [Novosphingobium sp. 16-62-11]|uniref:MOSC domain-containing protein n=1 Tax=Novosphingobium sp. 17-62-19 TaxID=1970406 RepID=UPI000BD46DB4|nr:MOSC domain-containing protein [Novosphingobium sp. 17-62-19]OYX95208.1 MAG: MOSC domain-containing protein [Novosphingobium sp. 35-62-5]OYZ34696.1 MAG: MOSC domain-containing protein [Novosphingobium sp. 16-62-11]OZA17700.1 MAG: MOSC domain-containing protein [Novosphingobium sp. 17-62-19]OZA61272.1 MAG: MOSC domain-containing protein [Sphingomonadales bacterium 39-62-4]